MEEEKERPKKLPEVIYCSGGSDALNVAMHGYPVVWGNSETYKLTQKQFNDLAKKVEKVMYIGDLDETGKRESHRIGMEFLDLYIIDLPEELQQHYDKRGNACKDIKDYFEYNTRFNFKELYNTAKPYRFWDEEWIQ